MKLSKIETTLILIALIVIAGFFLFPVYWDIITSIKHREDIMVFPPIYFPINPTIESWDFVLTKRPATQISMSNSVIVASFTTLFTIILGAPAAYGLTRGNFRNKETIAFIMIAPLLLTGVIILIPLYALMAMIGLINTLYSVIFLMSVWNLPIVVWILRGFFERIPVEVEESALVDGCSRIGALVRITLPLAVNGIGAAAIYTFVVAWNEFWIPFIFTSSVEVQTAPLSVWGFFVATYEIFWGKFAAYTTLAIAPPIILFLLFQKIFVEGMVRGAIKG